MKPIADVRSFGPAKTCGARRPRCYKHTSTSDDKDSLPGCEHWHDRLSCSRDIYLVLITSTVSFMISHLHISKQPQSYLRPLATPAKMKTHALFLAVASLASATDQHKSQCGTYVSAIEGLTQAGYKAGWIIDGKNWDALPEVFTQDVFYDSTELGEYGGQSKGMDETRSALIAASKDSKTERIVTNLWLKEMVAPGKARVLTQWVLQSLERR